MGPNETRLKAAYSRCSSYPKCLNCNRGMSTEACGCSWNNIRKAFRAADCNVVDPSLLGHLTKLGPRGFAVLTAIAARLAKGAAEHGDFENLDRDWTQEALEEDLDGIIYRTVETMRRAGKL